MMKIEDDCLIALQQYGSVFMCCLEGDFEYQLERLIGRSFWLFV